MLSLFVSILVLGFVVFIHELGHFIAAKRAGVFVEEFGFGLPPRIFGKKIGNTIYSVNIFPFQYIIMGSPRRIISLVTWA